MPWVVESKRASASFANFESTFDGERAIAELNGHSVGARRVWVELNRSKNQAGSEDAAFDGRVKNLITV